MRTQGRRKEVSDYLFKANVKFMNKESSQPLVLVLTHCKAHW